MKIVQIDHTAAEELSALAKAIYREHYLHLWHPGGAEWYMDIYAYPVEKIRQELSDPQNRHYIVYDESHTALGYLKLKMNVLLKGFEKDSCMELERIYLHLHATGKGAGSALLKFSEQVATGAGMNRVFLKAMDSSTRAISFYKKCGFTECGTWVLPFPLLKEEYRGMIILQKPFIK